MSAGEPGSNSPEDVGSRENGGWTGGLNLGTVTGVARCPSCRKPIRFVRMASGKEMPVEAKEVEFIVERRSTLQADLFSGDVAPEVAGHLVRGWTPHWSVCSDPNRWRKSR